MKKLKWIASNIPELIAGISFCTILVVVFINVVLRYFFRYAIVWYEEIAAMGFTWMIFVGAAACYKRKGLIGIDFLIDILPHKIQCVVQVIIDFFMMGANLLLCWLSISFTIGAWPKISLSLNISYAFFDAATTVGFLYMLYYSVRHFISDITGKEYHNHDEETADEGGVL